jgi:AcrR family transcriptional regulator
MSRSTYRHGDLHRALLAAGTELAREGGPGAVVLREATRRVGVSPNAAYRHFADHRALLQAVSEGAMAQLARAMETELASISARLNPADVARARLRAVGTGYLRFAQAEPGLFRAAFSMDTLASGDSGLTPYELLSSALDDLVVAGVLPPSRREGAEVLAWSAVHGLSMLVIDGPLRGMSDDERRAAAGRLLDMVQKGL